MRLFNKILSRMPFCLLYEGLDNVPSIPALREAVRIEINLIDEGQDSYTADEVKQIRAYYALLQRQQ